jgi:PAS domain S-box-containing protein
MGDAVNLEACARNEAKRDGEDQFRLIADAVPMIIWVVEPSGACTYVNWRWYEYTGQAPGEGEGEGWLRCVHPEDLATAHGDMEAAMARYEPFRIEYRLRRHDGAWRWVLGAGAARFDERTGAFLGYVGSVIDIDERRRAEEQVLELSGRSALALAAGGMGTWDWDIAADRLVWDAQESRLFGLTPGQAPRTGADFLALVHPEDRAELEEAGSQAALTGKGFEGEYRIVRPDGAVRWLAERCATVREILAETGVPPGQLTIEVTEGVFLGRGADRVADELRALHTLGVAVALDDFGTGYGSLAHLKRFPVDMLKIDQSFVRDMLQDPGDAVIVRAIVGLSHNLGLTVTAEGVETEEQADWLRLQGCDWGQGYLFGRPMPAEEVAGWLDRRRSEDDPNTRPLRGRLGPAQLHRPVE